MPEQPRRRKTLADYYAEGWPNATPEQLAKLYEQFGYPDEEIYTFKDVMRILRLESEDK